MKACCVHYGGVFKLAGKTHYSNASFLVGTGLSALAFASKLPVNI